MSLWMNALALTTSIAITMTNSLYADSIVAKNRSVFEGIVTKVDTLGDRLTLSTGYGDISFKIESEILDANLSEYNWPETSQLRKPDRSSEFNELVARIRINAQKQTWSKVDVGLGNNEIDATELSEAVRIFNATDFGKLSAKEIKAVRENFQKKYNNSECLVAIRIVRISVLKEQSVETIHLSLTGELFDCRTGVKLQSELALAGYIVAKSNLKPAEVDARNVNTEVGYETGWDRQWHIDYSVAENIKAGDGLVFRLKLHVDGEGRAGFKVSPIRLEPRTKPIAKDGK